MSLCSFFQDVDYTTFKLVLDTYLDIETPEELCQHVFLSFVKKPSIVQPVLKEMAALSSTTICAPILSEANAEGSLKFPGLSERLHGITEKLGSLGHIRSDSEVAIRTRTGRYIYIFLIASLIFVLLLCYEGLHLNKFIKFSFFR